MSRPDYTLYEKGVRAAKAAKSSMRQAAFVEYAQKRNGYYTAVAEGKIQRDAEGKIPAFPPMEGCLG